MTCTIDSASSVTVGVWQEREETRTFDRGVELALVVGLGARQTRRHDLAVVGDEIAQRLQILVIDLLDAFDRKTTELLALEKSVLLVATPTALAALALRFAFAKCHFDLLNPLRIR